MKKKRLSVLIAFVMMVTVFVSPMVGTSEDYTDEFAKKESPIIVPFSDDRNPW